MFSGKTFHNFQRERLLLLGLATSGPDERYVTLPKRKDCRL
jgi:hypothetical protein